MTERRVRAWAVTSTRLVVGAAAAAGLVLVTVFAVAAPWPGHAAAPVAVTATPAAADTVLACSGPLVALGRNRTDAAQLTQAAAQSVVSATDGAAAQQSALTPSPAVSGGAGGASFSASPRGGVPVDVAAAGSASVEADDLRGFAASACRPALTESWLIGGATTVGTSDLVVLSNPGTVPATVDITVYTATGAEVPTGGSGIVVAPGMQRILPLSGIVPGAKAPVLRVTATGAPVAAALQSSIIRTLLPGGVDVMSATAQTSTRVVVPGVVVPPSAVTTTGGLATTIARILSPQTDTAATVTVDAPDGTQVSTRQVPLTAGVPLEVELTGLPAGTYTVTVSAGAGVLAAVWQTTGFGQGDDFAWYSSAPEVSADTLVAVPDGPAPTLVVTATGQTRVSVTPVAGGSTQTSVLTAGSSAVLPLAPGTVYRLSSGGVPVHAQLSYSGTGQLAAVPVWSAGAAASALTVIP
ncbi:DUF5719 family protein [Microbacterium sp. SORGH_AS_0888]|uniref:DUF5719 family protein n=1 Tax=Microbacterium sp. SORGH_AS_0888 TaxID=3041791 RepID=UPI002780811C|nr:DUF5719 family protein [Microbacterium sp. SORGH_AS_0888]MDQ1127907.1 hypothetical protein [Microbacterium sp. SORGH_AS_0888]